MTTKPLGACEWYKQFNRTSGSSIHHGEPHPELQSCIGWRPLESQVGEKGEAMPGFRDGVPPTKMQGMRAKIPGCDCGAAAPSVSPQVNRDKDWEQWEHRRVVLGYKTCLRCGTEWLGDAPCPKCAPSVSPKCPTCGSVQREYRNVLRGPNTCTDPWHDERTSDSGALTLEFLAAHDKCNACHGTGYTEKSGFTDKCDSGGMSASLVAILDAHWITTIHCNHEAKTDQALCYCGWRGGEYRSVGEAVRSWANHVAEAFAAHVSQADAQRNYDRAFNEGRRVNNIHQAEQLQELRKKLAEAERQRDEALKHKAIFRKERDEADDEARKARAEVRELREGLRRLRQMAHDTPSLKAPGALVRIEREAERLLAEKQENV